MKRPAISVVMGVRNGAAWLAETLDSVLAQTERDFEFIVVNDGSTDPRVGEMLAGYAKRDPRFRVMEKVNEGLTRALIDGCAAARASLVARIDVGDAMRPERLARQRAVLDGHAGVAFVSCWTEFCGPAWEPLFVVEGAPAPETGMDVLPAAPDADLRAGPTHHGSVMFRRSAYEAAGGYRAAFYFGQDWDLWYRLAEQGAFAMVPEVLYRGRVLAVGVSVGHRRRQEALGRCSREAMRLRRCGRDESPALARAARVRPRAVRSGGTRATEAGACHFVGEALRRRGDPRALDYLRRAWRLRPWHPGACTRYLQARWGAKRS